MNGTNQYNSEIHSKIENFKYLWIENTKKYESFINIFFPSFSVFTCDLANAKIKIPQNLVKVIPLKTLPPSFDNASLARSSFVPSALQNALTICETNSTPIPMHCNNYNNNNKQKLLENDYHYYCYWQVFDACYMFGCIFPISSFDCITKTS